MMYSPATSPLSAATTLYKITHLISRDGESGHQQEERITTTEGLSKQDN